MTGAVEWLFRNRRTGRITIAQWPNLPLGVWIIAVVVDRLTDPTGALGTALSVVVSAALMWWAIDEIVRGVNPWRRILGAAVLAAQVGRVLS